MAKPNASAAPGEGGRFAALKAKIEARNKRGPKRPAVAAKRPGGGKIEDSGALAAWIGRAKYSKPVFQKMAAAGRRGG